MQMLTVFAKHALYAQTTQAIAASLLPYLALTVMVTHSAEVVTRTDLWCGMAAGSIGLLRYTCVLDGLDTLQSRENDRVFQAGLLQLPT